MSLLYAAPRAGTSACTRSTINTDSRPAPAPSAQDPTSPDQASSSMFIFPSSSCNATSEPGASSDAGCSGSSDAGYSVLSVADLSPLSPTERSPYLDSLSGFSGSSSSISPHGSMDSPEMLSDSHALHRSPRTAQRNQSNHVRPRMGRGTWQWDELRPQRHKDGPHPPQRSKLSHTIQRRQYNEPQRTEHWFLSILASLFAIDRDTLALVSGDAGHPGGLLPGHPTSVRYDEEEVNDEGDSRVGWLLREASGEGRTLRGAVASLSEG
ncbi:hypothetical protein HDZ31DRAFT_37072 [Schizophyllum fasciatum]